MALLAATLLAGIAIVLAFGSYARRETVQGRLVPAGGLLDVATNAAGIVTRLLVSEGERVIEGQGLVEISPDIVVADDGGAVAQRIAVEMDRRLAQLSQDLRNLDTAHEQQEAALQRLIGSLKRQLASVDSEILLRQQQADSAARMLERIRPLWDSRTLSDVQVQQYEDQALNARAALEIAKRNRIETENALAEAQDQLKELPLTSAARRSDIDGTLAELSQSRVRNLAEQATLLKAPASGIVSGLTVAQGQAVGERQRLLSIIPEQTGLQAELWAPSQAVGRVETGDEVILRYHAFPYQTFGRQRGRVLEIAGSPLSPTEVQDHAGIDPGQPAFRVLVGLDSQHVPDGASARALRAGMSLDADLVQERRRLYEWLFAPRGTKPSMNGADQVAAKQP